MILLEQLRNKRKIHRKKESQQLSNCVFKYQWGFQKIFQFLTLPLIDTWKIEFYKWWYKIFQSIWNNCQMSFIACPIIFLSKSNPYEFNMLDLQCVQNYSRNRMQRTEMNFSTWEEIFFWASQEFVLGNLFN